MVISFKKTVASSLSGWNIIFSVLPLYTGWPDVWLHFEGKRYDRNLYKFNNIYLVISYIFGYITKYLKVSPSYVLIGCLSVCMFVCCLITQKWLNRLGCNVYRYLRLGPGMVLSWKKSGSGSRFAGKPEKTVFKGVS